ncbi:RNA-guided endonuclease IscB [Malikia sp.]|uniref:RNA-guided endonuclease IscB n=1 Tax=Malikia sp. TaxID=2070706 RepID=UPI00260627DA|nr:RNA-guided endonuclease IscB [Malikia sp.]MDD2727588.1 RNA-guided endonuclease IscB [Malikia sp.]
MSVFVLDRRGQPLMPCSEKRARLLLERGRARLHRVVPFVIRLIDREADRCTLQPLRVKLDPGSRTTGLALVRETESVEPDTGEVLPGAAVLQLLELAHRGHAISDALTARRAMRRRRRGHLRYRAPRFLNRRRAKGWLPPSLQHRVNTSLAWVQRLQRWAPVTALSSELVRFDLQAIQNPEISGVEYQQGTLAGYETREYLLEKWDRTCAYCGAQNVPLQIEHIQPRARGGSDRVSNLTLACACCNQKKGAQPIESFLAKDPQRLRRLLAQARQPLKDAAAVNATRWALAQALKATGLPVELASGGRTKFNRARLGIPKTHALDAVCVGSLAAIAHWQRPTLMIKATGRGSYQRTRLNKFGFPRGYLMRTKRVKGFGTGDLVKATVPTGKKVGCYTGRVAVRATGSFNIQTGSEVVQGVSHRHCRLIQRNDGYGYSQQQIFTKKEAGEGRAKRTTPLCLPGLKAEVSRAI